MNTATPLRAGAREWIGLAVLALPTILLGLDVTVLYLALPHLATDLQPTSDQTLWIMDAYGFLIAGFLITMGTLGDRIGRRRLLLIGAAAFGVVSTVAAYATSAEMLIAARAALGVAGATLMPSTLALISNMFTDARQRAMAIGVWATMFALGMAAGPLVGGALLERFWWGSAFLVAVPVVVILLLAAPALLPEYRDPRPGRIDLVSVALSLAAVLPLVYAVKHTAADGPDVLAGTTLLVGAVFAVVFVRRQRGRTDPLLDVRLFADRTFSAALGVLLVGLVGVGGVMLLVTQYLQLVERLSPWAAGAWMAPPAAAMFLAAISAPVIARRFRPGWVVAATLGLSTIGYLLLSQAGGSAGLVSVVTGFSLVYLGLGAVAALGTDLVVGAAPASRAGSASAMSETVQELGIAAGVALLGSLSTGVYRTRIGEVMPTDLPVETAETVREGLSGAVSVAHHLPEGLLRRAQEAFLAGLNIASGVAGLLILGLALVSAIALRHIGTLGSQGYTGGHPGSSAEPPDTGESEGPDSDVCATASLPPGRGSR